MLLSGNRLGCIYDGPPFSFGLFPLQVAPCSPGPLFLNIKMSSLFKAKNHILQSHFVLQGGDALTREPYASLPLELLQPTHQHPTFSKEST